MLRPRTTGGVLHLSPQVVSRRPWDEGPGFVHPSGKGRRATAWERNPAVAHPSSCQHAGSHTLSRAPERGRHPLQSGGLHVHDEETRPPPGPTPQEARCRLSACASAAVGRSPSAATTRRYASPVTARSAPSSSQPYGRASCAQPRSHLERRTSSPAAPSATTSGTSTVSVPRTSGASGSLELGPARAAVSPSSQPDPIRRLARSGARAWCGPDSTLSRCISAARAPAGCPAADGGGLAAYAHPVRPSLRILRGGRPPDHRPCGAAQQRRPAHGRQRRPSVQELQQLEARRPARRMETPRRLPPRGVGR
jgi:hypothetical protein